MKAWHKFMFITLTLFMATACTTKPELGKTGVGVLVGAAGGAVVGSTTSLGAPAGAAIGAVGGGIVGHAIERRDNPPKPKPEPTVEELLLKEGVQIQQVGQETTIIIPSDKLFVLDSTRYVSGADVLLGKVLVLLAKYPNKPVLTVSAYSDRELSPERARMITRTQAEAITTYLWNNGIDARVISAKGLGETNDATKSAQAENQRVEIYFRTFATR